ncbi:cytochrome c, partial [Maribacter arcticus]|uniref:c-type cytochrome n=1 Tax=Maribacter arcticus TaxID=561365 RepID=UPI0030D8554C
MDLKTAFYISFLFLFISCTTENRPREVVLYENYCASCHIAPDIQDLPKDIWKNSVLPAMAARMGILTAENHPYHNLSFPEQMAIIKTGIFPSKPIIEADDWELLKNYIIDLAPDSIANNNARIKSSPLSQFKSSPISLDSAVGSLYTFLKIDAINSTILTGTRKGELASFNLKTKENKLKGYFNRAITDAKIVGDSTYVTSMGLLVPSEIPNGKII